jgi:hypothetical protein
MREGALLDEAWMVQETPKKEKQNKNRNNKLTAMIGLPSSKCAG